MATSSPPDGLSGYGLPDGWQRHPVWRVLDTHFGDGSAFFLTLQAWAEAPVQAFSTRQLHYVAIARQAPDADAVMRRLAGSAAAAAHCKDLARQLFGLLPGFHRVVLMHGQVQLTLCVGQLQPMLREQRFMADAVYLAGLQDPSERAQWDRWTVKALARLCRRGTGIVLDAPATPLCDVLAQAGFALGWHDQPAAAAGSGSLAVSALSGRYQPAWQPGTTRHSWRVAPPAPTRCVVVGAGLAGATVAAMLARRGWQVTVLDRAAEPAMGASGLPVGLLLPQVSQDDNTRSRLSRAGVRQTLALCHDLLVHGDDWALSGVLALPRAGAPQLPADWPAAGRQWSDGARLGSVQAAWTRGQARREGAIWHTAAAWIKPAQLVRACLALGGVVFRGSSDVRAIEWVADTWVLRDATGHLLADAPLVVVAAASESVRLLDSAAVAAPRAPTPVTRLAKMPSIAGQVSWGLQSGIADAAFPPFPVNGAGSLVANVPLDGALAWYAGATYSAEGAGAVTASDEAQGHRDNLARVAQLLPATASALQTQFDSGQLRAWHGSRCTTADRLPAVGRLDTGPGPGLWVSTGMGSRGLTYAVLCAEVLACQLGAEPLPVPASLVKSVSATRGRLLNHG